MSDHKGAALIERGIAPCIPSTRSRKVALPYDKTLYRQRHRIALRPVRPHLFLAICLVAAVTFSLS